MQYHRNEWPGVEGHCRFYSVELSNYIDQTYVKLARRCGFVLRNLAHHADTRTIRGQCANLGRSTGDSGAKVGSESVATKAVTERLYPLHRKAINHLYLRIITAPHLTLLFKLLILGIFAIY